MEVKEVSNELFEDLTINEEEFQGTKGGPPRKGFYSSYTHFISIPLLGESINGEFASLQVIIKYSR